MEEYNANTEKNIYLFISCTKSLMRFKVNKTAGHWAAVHKDVYLII